MKTYKITYIIDGIRMVDFVEAKNARFARALLLAYNIETVIVSVRLYHI